MKKSLLISLIVGLLIILGAVGFYFFFHSAPTITTPVTTATSSPFGSGGDVTSTTGTGSTNSTGSTGTPNGVPAKLIQISSTPVAGAVSLLKNNTEIVRYVDRADGHIYDVNPNTLEKTEIVNTTQPEIYQALFSADGSKVIYRSLVGSSDSISNLSLALTPPATSTSKTIVVATSTAATSTNMLYQVATTPIHGTLTDMIVTSDGRLAYVSIDQKAVALSNIDGTKGVSVLTSAFTDWRISGGTKASIILTTKASAGVSGYAYVLPATGGALSKLIGPLPGLIALANKDDSRILYSTSDGANTTLEALVASTGAIESLSPATLAEKCAWSAIQKNIVFCAAPTTGVEAGQPDLWYQGETHFADRLWKLDTDSGSASLLASPSIDIKKDIDAINLTLSPDEDYLIFMNKTDLTLWALRLN